MAIVNLRMLHLLVLMIDRLTDGCMGAARFRADDEGVPLHDGCCHSGAESVKAHTQAALGADSSSRAGRDEGDWPYSKGRP